MLKSQENILSATFVYQVTPHVTYSWEDGILIGTYKKGITIDLKTAQEIVAHRLEASEGRSFVALADVRGIKVSTKEARDYFAKEGTKGLTALAILTGNYLTAAMSNFYIKFSKPKIPTRVFKTREEALKWLRQFIKEG